MSGFSYSSATALGTNAVVREDGAFGISLTNDPNDQCQIEFKPDGTVVVPSGCSLEELATAASKTLFDILQLDDVTDQTKHEVLARLVHAALRASVLNPLDKIIR